MFVDLYFSWIMKSKDGVIIVVKGQIIKIWTELNTQLFEEWNANDH